MSAKPRAARVQRHFRAMGTDVHVILDTDTRSDAAPSSLPRRDPQSQLQAVVDGVENLEARWSRFRDSSELSRLNARDGRATLISPVTSLLLQRAVTAWHATRGRFDPTVLDAVIGAGYDRNFEVRAPDTAEHATIRPASTGYHPAPGCEGILIDAAANLAILPPGVKVDPGGIGKGLAADLTATAAIASGAAAALVSLGGDLRVAGTPPAEGWEIEIDHHITEPARINLRAGAVATSSVLRRCWTTPDGPAHHIINPRTGTPSTSDAVAVSVVTGEAWWAEVLATAVLVDYGNPAFAVELEDLLGSAGALVTLADGTQLTFGAAGRSFSTRSSPPWSAFHAEKVS